MNKFFRLFGDGFDDAWVAVAGRGDRDPRRKVDVFIAIDISQMGSAA
jgi:hypothetical protein